MNNESSSNENMLYIDASNTNSSMHHRNHENHRNYDNLNLNIAVNIEEEKEQSIECLSDTKWPPRVVNVNDNLYDDKYRINTNKKLGSGSFGVVYKATSNQDPNKL